MKLPSARVLATAAGVAASGLFLPYQRAYILDEAPVVMWEKGRRVGADFSDAFRAVRERMSGHRATDLWYSSADESAAAEYMEYVRMWGRDVYGAAFEINDGVEQFDQHDVKVMSIRLPEVNGRRCRITAMASNPKSFRSKGGDVVLSEFAFHERAAELWKAASPVTMWGGRIRVISTHNGVDSLFNELLGQARRRLDPDTPVRETDLAASVHRTTIHDAVEQGLVERINQVSRQSFTREQFVAAEKAKCGDPLVWREEYECVPSEESQSYFPFDLLRPIATSRVRPTESVTTFLRDVIIAAKGVGEGPPADCLFGGCDVGRRRDLFTLWVHAKVGGMRRTAGVLRLSDVRFDVMESAIHSLMSIDVGGGVRRLAIDATGLGMQLAERMQERYRGRVEPVTVTAPVKEDLVTTARRDFEERTTDLPDDVGTLGQFNSFRRELTSAGNVRYVADATAEGHADEAFACFLSLHAAKRPGSRARSVEAEGGVLA